jgi:hypothetical protein
MFNTNGQLMIKRSIEHNGGNSVQTISVGNLAAGVYTLKIINRSIPFVKQIIIEQ